MKTLNEHLQNIRPIFEISDELLKRAIAKSKEQNTSLSRRRAREFQNWLENPERYAMYKKFDEISGKSKSYRLFKEVYDEYFDKGMEAYNDKRKKDCQNYFNNFYNGLIKSILSIKTNKVQIKSNMNYWRCQSKNHNWLTDNFATFVPRYRKDSDCIFDSYGIKLFFVFDGYDDEVFKSHGYEKTSSFDLYLNITKDGKLSSYFNFKYHKIAPEFRNDIKKIFDLFNEIGMNHPDYYWFDLLFGDKKLEDKLSVKDIIDNYFKINIEDYSSAKKVLNELCDVLKKLDENCSVEIGDSETISVPANIWFGAGQTYRTEAKTVAKLTFCGKEHYLTSNKSSDAFTSSMRISFDDIEKGIYATREYYDVGVWIGGNVTINNAVIDILEKDYK